MRMSKLYVEFVYPPIPLRQFDWMAYLDPEDSARGNGETKQAAINDLFNNYGRPTDGGCLGCESDVGEACRSDCLRYSEPVEHS